MACTRQCGVLAGAITLVIVGVLFLIMGGIVKMVVTKGIDNKITDAISVGYNRSWDAKDQAKFLCATTDYDFYGFNITNLDAAMLGAKFDVKETGPYYYREYTYRYNVDFQNNDDGETLAFNIWWQTLPKNDSNDYNVNKGFETVPIVTVNPVYLNLVYGLRSQLGISAPPNETSTLAFLTGVAGISGIYDFFTNATTGLGNFNTLAKFLAVQGYLVQSSMTASNLPTDFALTSASITLQEATILLNGGLAINSVSGIQAWYGAITEAPPLTTIKNQVIGGLTLAVSQVNTSINASDLYTRVRTYLIERADKSGLDTQTFTLLGTKNGLSEMQTSPSWAKLGLLQFARAAYSKVSSSPSVDPNFNKSNSIYSQVYFGPEFANYAIIPDVMSWSYANISALFTVIGNATTLQEIAFLTITNSTHPKLVAVLGDYNPINFYRYIFQVVPSFVVLESVVKLNGGLFTRRPASQIQWGYPATSPDPILATLGVPFTGLSTTTANQADGLLQVPGKYQWYTGRGVDRNLASMYYAYKNITRFTKVTDLWYFRNVTECTAIGDPGACKLWQSEEVIQGTSTTSYYGPSLDSDRNRVLKLWNPDTYRVINFTYYSENVVKGIKTYKYELDPAMLKNSTANPANAKYYMDIDGFAPITRAAKNIPFHLSRPHLYNTFGDVQTRITGLNVGLNDSEVRRLYWTEIDVEPKTGAAVSGNKRLQLNIRFRKSDFVPFTRYSGMFNLRSDDIYLPMFWVNQHNIVNDTDAADAVDKLDQIDKANNIADILRIVGFVVGSVLAAAGLALFFYYYQLRAGAGGSQLKSSTELYVGK